MHCYLSTAIANIVTEAAIANIVTYQVLLPTLLTINCYCQDCGHRSCYCQHCGHRNYYCQHCYLSTAIAQVVTYQLLLPTFLPINCFCQHCGHRSCYCQHSYLSTAIANIVVTEAAIARCEMKVEILQNIKPNIQFLHKDS